MSNYLKPLYWIGSSKKDLMSLLGLIRDVFEYVLHCFQKKSTSGIQTPKPDMDLIHERFKVAQANAKGNTK